MRLTRKVKKATDELYVLALIWWIHIRHLFNWNLRSILANKPCLGGVDITGDKSIIKLLTTFIAIFLKLYLGSK